MTVSFIEKDQNWADETTIYWFFVDLEIYAIADKNGELTLRDDDGWVIEDDNIKAMLLPLYEEHKTNNQTMGAK